MVEHGDEGAIALLEPWLFGVANLVVLLITIGTIRLLLQGHLLPPPAYCTLP
jgi:tellurite resistance protein